MIYETFHDAANEKPGLWETVRAWKADGTSEPAMWTGNRWWTGNGSILVETWQFMRRSEGALICLTAPSGHPEHRTGLF
jgi:hypothetical protein